MRGGEQRLDTVTAWTEAECRSALAYLTGLDPAAFDTCAEFIAQQEVKA